MRPPPRRPRRPSAPSNAKIAEGFELIIELLGYVLLSIHHPMPSEMVLGIAKKCGVRIEERPAPPEEGDELH